MKSASNKQHGFGIVELLVIVAAVGLLTGGGWLVYNNYRSKHPVAATANGTTTDKSEQTTSANTPAQQTATQYLDVKEWGVQIPLSDSIKDAYYVVPPGISDDPDGKPSGIYLGLSSTDSACGKVTASATGIDSAIGGITRTTTDYTDPISGKPFTQLYPGGVTINGYYYSYASRISDKSCVPQATLQADSSALESAVKNTAQAASTSASSN